MDPEIFPEKEEVQKERKNTASTILVSNKRKRVVESDFEDESGSEDHVPLAQRQFQRSQTNNSVPRDELGDNTVRRNEPDTDNESRKHDQDSGASAGLRLSPALNRNDTSSRSVYTNESRKHDQDSGASADVRLSPAFDTNNAFSRSVYTNICNQEKGLEKKFKIGQSCGCKENLQSI